MAKAIPDETLGGGAGSPIATESAAARVVRPFSQHGCGEQGYARLILGIEHPAGGKGARKSDKALLIGWYDDQVDSGGLTPAYTIGG